MVKLGMIGLAFLALVGCSSGKGFSEQTANKDANTYTWITRYDVKTLDPAAIQDWTTGKVLSYLYPSIGQLGKIGCDKPSVYFGSVDGKKFSNGDPVTAEDIRFTLERCIRPESLSSVGNQFAMQIRGSDEFLSGKTDHVEGIKITSPSSFSIILKHIDTSYGNKLMNSAFGVLNHKLVDLRKPITDAKLGYGAGKWTMESFAPGQEWKIKNSADGHFIRFRFVGDSATRRNLFDQGQADYAMFGAHEAGVVKGSKFLTKGGPTTLVYLQINPKTKPELNQALRYQIGAFIRSEVKFDQLLMNMVDPARSFLQLSGVEPIPAKHPATILGYIGKPSLEITYAEIGMQNPSVEGIVACLRKNGLDVKGRAMPSGAMLEANSRGEIPILFTGWQPDFVGPLNTVPMLFHSKSSENHSGYRNAKVDELIDKAQQGIDAEKNMQQANQIIESEAPCIPLYVQRDLVLQRREPPVP